MYCVSSASHLIVSKRIKQLVLCFSRDAPALAYHSWSRPVPPCENLSVAHRYLQLLEYPSARLSICSSANFFPRLPPPPLWKRKATGRATEEFLSESSNFEEAEGTNGPPTKTAVVTGEGEKQDGGLPWYPAAPSQPPSVEVPESGVKDIATVSTMVDLFDLEKQFAFYGSYHSNKINILIHVMFVWPIYYTSLILWAYTAPLAPLPLAGGTLPLQEYMVLNWSFIQASVYSVYYVALDKRAGSLGAALCLGCWIGANAFAQALPWSLGWKIVLASQVICWSAQIYGHQKFEGRSPALLDNLSQAFLMAPFFVLLESLQSVFGYEPYPGFQKSVQQKVDAAIRKFRAFQGKRTT